MGLTDEDTTTSEDPSVQDSLMLGQKVNKKNAPGSVPVEGDPTKSTSNSSKHKP